MADVMMADFKNLGFRDLGILRLAQHPTIKRISTSQNH